ncbi:2Fe-2S ferredoxin-type domain-containing protein [Lipomyces chichibuensis]|uniref:2Fe-2S ferredoxin-type domain-containing protein n=1 Tax=Lipomyces chichibuensis TaxID=1546026 RepID=UPI003343899B
MCYADVLTVIFTTRNLVKSMSSHIVALIVCRPEGLMTCDLRIHVTFITREGDQVHIDAAEGDNLLDIAQAHDLDMEGACGGSCACSTCHVIVDPEFYDLIPEPDDDENDMLDLAFGLTETSRLGCQVKLTKELDGLRVALPQMTRNLQAKDFEKR